MYPSHGKDEDEEPNTGRSDQLSQTESCRRAVDERGSRSRQECRRYKQEYGGHCADLTLPEQELRTDLAGIGRDLVVAWSHIVDFGRAVEIFAHIRACGADRGRWLGCVIGESKVRRKYMIDPPLSQRFGSL